ncbi:Hsp70 family protein [Nocardia sp. NPDC051570]|uniref:Hsp70 family protein n=1 Tax=Nocardia sp. NPDC051570 TaxID=3364324 RepID=UPI00378D16D1
MIIPNRGRGESENVGIGLGIGAVSTVHATASESEPLSVTTRTTSVTVDPDSSAVTDFADLARYPETVTLGGRIFSPATLVAEWVRELTPADAQVVCTYPACYDDKQVAQLRQALDLSGARQVRLLAEPLAALTWLDHEHGPLTPGRVLVYDLGATSLDVTVVEVDADGERRIIGTPVRSYDFGGRPLGAMIVRYVGDVLGSPPGRRLPVSLADSDELRAWHVRDSLAVVWDCLRAAELGIGDIARILVVGGASRAPEVARALAELGPPIVMSADPAHCVAAGAAWSAMRPSARVLPLSIVRAGPSMVSAVAALSVLGLATAALLTPTAGSGEMWRESPVAGGAPNVSSPLDSADEPQARTVSPDAVLSVAMGEAVNGAGVALPAPRNPVPGMASPVAPKVPAASAPVPSPDSATGGGYSDPSRFENPLPFDSSGGANTGADHSQNFGPPTGFSGTIPNTRSTDQTSGQGGSTSTAGQGGSSPTGHSGGEITTGGGATTGGGTTTGGSATTGGGDTSTSGSASSGTGEAGNISGTGGAGGDTRSGAGDVSGGASGGGTATTGGSTTGGSTSTDHSAPAAGGAASVHGSVGGSLGGAGGFGGGGGAHSMGGFGH